MKKSLTVLLLLLSLNVVAQKHRERVKALKVSFITEKLDLTEKEGLEAYVKYPLFYQQSKKSFAKNKPFHPDLLFYNEAELKQNLQNLNLLNIATSGAKRNRISH